MNTKLSVTSLFIALGLAAFACGDDSGSGGSGATGGDGGGTTTTTTTGTTTTTTTGTTTTGTTTTGTTTTGTTTTGTTSTTTATTSSGMGGAGGSGGGSNSVTCVDVLDPNLGCMAPDAAACECAGCALPACDDGMGGLNDCVCSSCASDPFCSNPQNCNQDGVCDPFNEGCVCADCYPHPQCAGQVEDCGNGVDDNNNGLIDCAEAAFCGNDPVCLQAACGAPTVINLGVTSGDTTGGTTLLESSCQGTGAPERVFTFTPAASGFLSITLASAADLGFYVRTTCTDSSSEIACEDAVAGGADETTQVPVTANVPITIVVDGFAAAEVGPFTLTLAIGDGCVSDSTCDILGGEPCTCADCVSSAQCGFCDNDAMCEFTDACTCSECSADPFCTDPQNCTNDGICDQFLEGCQCADCANAPNCP